MLNSETRSSRFFKLLKVNPAFALGHSGMDCWNPANMDLFPEASLQSWMTAVHAGMTMTCIFMRGRAWLMKYSPVNTSSQKTLNNQEIFARVVAA
jgi:hypothetical protein